MRLRKKNESNSNNNNITAAVTMKARKALKQAHFTWNQGKHNV